ncbi:uncharacterized protein LOC62_02G003221 [Vanrija pseudolonga]|uniref:Uncharacterized protein n=1 Tax=Vanrija pseudolonga TaxID=143232 RepID=A0AAF0Y860_9TREE|nr:hypothetical protein LOC62_02G003221 [Vanrija pseudolonga]
MATAAPPQSTFGLLFRPYEANYEGVFISGPPKIDTSLSEAAQLEERKRLWELEDYDLDKVQEKKVKELLELYASKAVDDRSVITAMSDRAPNCNEIDALLSGNRCRLLLDNLKKKTGFDKEYKATQLPNCSPIRQHTLHVLGCLINRYGYIDLNGLLVFPGSLALPFIAPQTVNSLFKVEKFRNLGSDNTGMWHAIDGTSTGDQGVILSLLMDLARLLSPQA